MSWWSYKPYVSVAQKRRQALERSRKLAKGGTKLSPVTIAGSKISSSFWGKAWCNNLEAYRDFEYRLPRGRSYVRSGAVLDLQIAPGKVAAKVSGSELYTVQVKIKPVAKTHWGRLRERCAGEVGSLIELLQGKLSARVMGIMTDQAHGLFPKPAEIEMSCSCPDIATMCKHVAAALYGVGARLDEQPELLFKLRQVDHEELIAKVTKLDVARKKSGQKTLAEDTLGAVFGIEIDAAPSSAPALPERSKLPAKVRKGASKTSKPTRRAKVLARGKRPTRAARDVKPRK